MKWKTLPQISTSPKSKLNNSMQDSLSDSDWKNKQETNNAKGPTYPRKSSKRWSTLPRTILHSTSKRLPVTFRNTKEGNGQPLKPSTKALFPTPKDTTLTLSKLLRPNIRMQIDSDSQVMESLKSMKPSKWQPKGVATLPMKTSSWNVSKNSEDLPSTTMPQPNKWTSRPNLWRRKPSAFQIPLNPLPKTKITTRSLHSTPSLLNESTKQNMTTPSFEQQPDVQITLTQETHQTSMENSRDKVDVFLATTGHKTSICGTTATIATTTTAATAAATKTPTATTTPT